ncbi:MAG: uroporphyrinogen methyltransferase / synthase [Abditibacteriota bacterium]|nr:uroporphyrinogen methyltransferase / synthase [Abditibacteriota bacterium]
MNIGTVFLVGAGPGDPKLITVRGREALATADVVVYDRLIGAELLTHVRADAEKIFVGKEAARHALPQDEINALLVEQALAGKSVCRLKGGDPFVFGRGGEEALFCRAHGVPFEIVPGVSSAIAAPAYAGIPVTQREVATSFAVVTGHTKDDEAPPENLPVADTIVFLMGVRALPKIVRALRAQGRAATTPVALVRWGTTTDQQVVTGTLETIEGDVERAALKPPALIVVGEVVNLREQLQWFDNPVTRPLWGQTIIVTRAREQASGLVEGLQQRGAKVLQCPTIRAEALEKFTVVDDAIARLNGFDWVVFSSANGVAHFWNRLQHAGKDARALAQSQIAAIGPATQQALAARGLNADFLPSVSISETVADELIARGVAGRRILLARAMEGREVLEARLRQAGAEVLLAPCYRTLTDNSNVESARAAIEKGEVDWVTFSSSSTVTNFLDALGRNFIAEHRACFRVACIGPITAQTAAENGLAPDAVAESAGIEALIAALEKTS